LSFSGAGCISFIRTPLSASGRGATIAAAVS
jgi:hypothetical protein